MDRTLFTDSSLGKLIQITIQDSSDWAFIPDRLPQSLVISHDIWPLLAEAREELARLDGVGRHMPDYELLLKPLQQREALKSSSLEGTMQRLKSYCCLKLSQRNRNLNMTK